MCRCCQSCWEDFKWNCFEERFCYDESIANYNPEEDMDYMTTMQKNGSALSHIQISDNNNLTVPIINQPVRRSNSGLMSTAKIHEEDYRRETQTNVPMLGPEILAVFANSQIFQDHQPTKLSRISTKTFLAGIHSPNKEVPTTPRETEQDRLIRRLEGDTSNAAATNAAVDKGTLGSVTPASAVTTPTDAPDGTAEKRITFTLTTDSSPEGSQTLTPKKFDVITEEDMLHSVVEPPKKSDSNEVILRPPRFIDRQTHLLGSTAGMSSPRKLKRSATSVPHFNVRSAASETDIFSITGSGSRISMTPEVPSISFSNLPKNYEDTPTIEKYRVSQSLYSIQTANAARVNQADYSMPRYFRRSAALTQSNELLSSAPSTSSMNSMSTSNEGMHHHKGEKGKSKRLQALRGNLPPLLIHSVSFRKNKEEGKQLD
ncbi:PREDICTED: uncharacterized protein LOC108359962 [Rhagoletis zephyria]|uniref:uncharacterized protein LOC108359962 n=1 Tax=Rhagoletis zephyria TaxID=28612 RepID=UPI0008118786|nr:PREDICTED: uncharacterized protein LOC108359962 [Rhagoletis zephyria]XP_017467556.1 PREDICTED: uncharacterized protein LOC108359962 [Rhagoletis zephyria]XP_017467557.1 PREDICTED: uncharacterized protein LOC108359962 [Rhagoletis zephyria]XP_017467558.1 PREDICTED: uncharacterized protein LOC108359962 [Rhagoletis zephyria]XP_017467559.1 PREDICTED: uncharacterized protein LOC108359962 [Rhagoletis zephyria]XP_017467560.1 PREDICTED: uncharacterized protein LOC108359962 [Rhagoletis zephyria]XP_01